MFCRYVRRLGILLILGDKTVNSGKAFYWSIVFWKETVVDVVFRFGWTRNVKRGLISGNMALGDQEINNNKVIKCIFSALRDILYMLYITEKSV